jgi:hypothetical protein
LTPNGVDSYRLVFIQNAGMKETIALPTRRLDGGIVKLAVAFLLLSAPVLAQDQVAIASAACGPANVIFEVRTDNPQHAVAQPPPEKALVYFVQEGTAACGAGGNDCIAKIGLDGAWVGAFQHNSYFAVVVAPGEHHACVALQGKSALGDRKGLSHFIAEPGRVYYLGMRALEVDLIAASPLSVFQPRK